MFAFLSVPVQIWVSDLQSIAGDFETCQNWYKHGDYVSHIFLETLVMCLMLLNMVEISFGFSNMKWLEISYLTSVLWWGLSTFRTFSLSYLIY